jgi:hypothetical protein
MPAAGRAYWGRFWNDVLKLKVDDPGYDYTRDFAPESNPAKRNFRITVPLMAHASGLGMRAVPFIRFALQGVLLVGLLLAAERACGDRLAALCAALAVAGTYVGTSVWMDEWRWLDNCAQAFMVLALVARRPAWAVAALLAAAFTDERALIAAPLIALFHAWTGGRRGLAWAPVAAVPIYLGMRLFLSLALHLHNAAAGIGTADMILPNLRVSPLGAWGALKGGWLLVALGLDPCRQSARRILPGCRFHRARRGLGRGHRFLPERLLCFPGRPGGPRAVGRIEAHRCGSLRSQGAAPRDGRRRGPFAPGAEHLHHGADVRAVERRNPHAVWGLTRAPRAPFELCRSRRTE